MSEKIKAGYLNWQKPRLPASSGLSGAGRGKLQVMGLPVSREIISQMELGPLQYPGQRLIALTRSRFTAFLMRSFFRACQTASKMQGRKAGAPVIK